MGRMQQGHLSTTVYLKTWKQAAPGLFMHCSGISPLENKAANLPMISNEIEMPF